MADFGAYLDKCMHLNAVLYPVAAPLHQPFGRTRGSAYAYRVDAFYPFALNLVGTFNKITVGINALALVEKHFAVAALAAADKENEVVALGKRTDVRHTVGYLTAYRVEAHECCVGRYVLLNVVDYAVKLVERLCCLRI